MKLYKYSISTQIFYFFYVCVNSFPILFSIIHFTIIYFNAKINLFGLWELFQDYLCVFLTCYHCSLSITWFWNSKVCQVLLLSSCGSF
jgi:hypothetical protein